MEDNNQKSKAPSPAEISAMKTIGSYMDLAKSHGGDAQLKNRLNSISNTLKSTESITTKAKQILSDCSKHLDQIGNQQKKAADLISDIEQTKTQIGTVMKNAEQALSSATSVGLAKEFDKRSNSFFWPTVFWFVVLVISLILAAGASSLRFGAMQSLLTQANDLSALVLLVNLLLSAVFVGAPIWLAWLSTKRLGYNFRFREDYAFKATISASYEGFRKAIDHYGDTDEGSKLQIKLLDSLVSQYNKEPLRFVDRHVAGMPASEAIDVLKKVKQITDNLLPTATKVEP